MHRCVTIRDRVLALVVVAVACETMVTPTIEQLSLTPNNNSPSDNVHSLTLHSRGVEFHRVKVLDRCRRQGCDTILDFTGTE
jgi:hypothetical protein